MSITYEYEILLHFTEEGTTKLRNIVNKLDENQWSKEFICNISKNSSDVELHIVHVSNVDFDAMEKVHRLHSGKLNTIKINVTSEDCDVYHMNECSLFRTYCFGNDIYNVLNVNPPIQKVQLKIYKNMLKPPTFC